MAEFIISKGILKGYKGDDEHVVIPEGVRKIDKKVFLNQTKLRSVQIPEGVSWIELEAFNGCTNLADISLPQSVQRIGNNAFRNTLWLKNAGDFVTVNGILVIYQGRNNDVVIPEGIIAICDKAFKGKKLRSVVIPEGVTTIAEGLFKDHAELKRVVLPTGLKYIGKDAFWDCSTLTDIVIPDSVSEIAWGAFHGCSSITSIVIPNGVTELSFAFWGCSSLRDIVIPDSVTKMSSTFWGCSDLQNVKLPHGVTCISSAFCGCTSLTTIEIPDSVADMRSGFWGCSNLKEIRLRQGVTKIGDSAFYGCERLTKIIIPDSVTEIEENAFAGCTSLRSICLPSKIQNIKSLGLGPMVHVEGLTNWQWQSLAQLPGWKCRVIDVQEYLANIEKEDDLYLHQPRGYSAFRGPAYIIDQLKQKLGNGVNCEYLPNGVAQIIYPPQITETIDNSALAAYPALRFACFDSDGDPIVLYSESGDREITQEYDLEFVKDEGDHWSYEARVLDSGVYEVFDTRSGETWTEQYSFPFEDEWNEDTYIIEEKGQHYLCSP